MDPLTLALSLGASGAKALQGLKQKRAAKKIQVGDRKLDPATEKAVRDAQTRATSGKFAGQDIQEEQQASDIGNLLQKGQALQNPAQQSGLIGQAMSQVTKNRRANQQTALADRQSRQAAATAALEGLGAKKEAISESNRQEAIAQKQALAGAATQNLQGALSDATGATANFAAGKLEDKKLNLEKLKLENSNKQGSTTSSSGQQQGSGEDNSLTQKQSPTDVTGKLSPVAIPNYGGFGKKEFSNEYDTWKQGAGKTENLTYDQWVAKYK